MKRACLLHDRANLLLLPILGSLAVLGLCGHVNTVLVTAFFTCYILADFVWIAAQPDAVPSLPSVILFHHAVTFVLLLFPLRYPQLGPYTCWDGLVEINTLFLIARRQLRIGRQLFSWLYWGTFFPLRTVMYPYLLVQFYREMQPYALWELAVVCGCQVILIGFNAVLLFLSLTNTVKRRQENKRTQGQPSSGAAVSAARATSVAMAAAIKPHMQDGRTSVRVQAKVL